MRDPFVLIDNARDPDVPARLYRDPVDLVIAREADDVAPALARIGAGGGHWAGMIAYEAGLALEPRLAPRLALRRGADGPLVWFARFACVDCLDDAALDRWLAENAGVGNADGGAARLGPLEPLIGPGGYARAFDAIRARITAGDTYQVNLTLPLGGTWAGDPLAIWRALRRDARAPHGAVVFDGAHWVLSASPELFFACADQAVTVRPMKGTAPRRADPAADAEAARKLGENAKDRAENLMIVDLMRNDLSRLAEPGSVRVARPFAIESYPTVHQMVSTVHARLRPGTGIGTLLKAIFPCGSVTGAPKIRAMELIDAVEPAARGIYCGAIGHIDGEPGIGTGRAVFNVAIRSVRLVPDHRGAAGGRAVMGVGSAVVADSTAMGEWRECMVKGNFVRRTQPAADLIETMAFDPARGIALIELHLSRLAASAAALDFAFDRHAARNAIQALCFDLVAPARVRLLLARSGAVALEAGEMPAVGTGPMLCAVLPLPVAADDWRLRHKTSDRGFYDAARKAAHAHGADEALLMRDDGLITEGSFTNVFVRRSDGRLITPRADLGLLPGVLRQSLIDADKVVEGDITIDHLTEGFLVGNALRGLCPARLIGEAA